MKNKELKNYSKVNLKEHCFNCNTNIDNVEQITESDIDKKELADDKPYTTGSYLLLLKVCPKCGKKNVTYSYTRTHEAFMKYAYL